MMARAGRQSRDDRQGLQLHGLTRRFGDLTALDELTFEVRSGQLFGFVGANGAGKTTAMRIIMGIDEPDAGEVRWRGQRPRPEDRARFGYMPEERGLYPKMGAAAQLAYFARLHEVPRDEADANARAWLDRLGLGDRADDRVEQLSQGNQQRVQLAAALVHDPELLVLDEPFGGLDPVAVDTMSDVLVEYAHDRGVPVIFSSHQLELVEALCDAVAIIDRGLLVASGAVAELRRRGRRRDRRLRIELEGRQDGPPPSGWVKDIDGVHVLDDVVEDGLHRVELRLDADDQPTRDRVLTAAAEAGSVLQFEELRPTLAELYREAIQQDDDTRTIAGGTP